MKKFSENSGNMAEISTNDETFLGTLMPSGNPGVVVLKLDSGYNIGIKKNKIKKFRIIKKFSKEKLKLQEIVHKKNLPTISILHTGGTIVSRVDYKTGGVTSAFTPEELIEMFPELNNVANFKTRLVRKMWSDDLR